MHRRTLLLVVAALVATLGLSLVLVYAQGAQERAEARFEPVRVLVASEEVPAGTPLRDALADGRVDLEPVAASAVLPGAVRESTPSTDEVLLASLLPGEQVVDARLGGADEVRPGATLPIPEGKVALSLSLSDQGRVGSFTRPGSRVAVFMTGVPDGSENDFTRMLLPDVQVLGIGSTSQVTAADEDAAEEDTPVPDTLLTLAVFQREAGQLLYAQAHGELSFALLPEGSRLGPSRRVDADNLFEAP